MALCGRQQRSGRGGLALLTPLMLLIAATGTIPKCAQAGILHGYQGKIDASAYVESDKDVQGSLIDGGGSYSAIARVTSPFGIGSANAKSTATLEEGGITAEVRSSAGRMSGAEAGSSGSLTLDFLVAGISSWDLLIDAAGHYSVELFTVGESVPLYSLHSNGWPGDMFEGSIPLTLESGAHRLQLAGSHFDSTAGVIESGRLSVTLVPVPATTSLLASALGLFLLRGRCRNRWSASR